MDLQKSILIANLYQHGLNATTTAWIRRNIPEGRYFGVEWHHDLISYRNRVVRDIVLQQPQDIEWALFVDNDVTITHPGVEAFLALPSDVGSCDCLMPPGCDPWQKPGSFHTTFWFARIEVFRRLSPPWFTFGYSADGCEMRACECQGFAERAVAAGFTVQHGGHCGHAHEGKWCG